MDNSRVKLLISSLVGATVDEIKSIIKSGGVFTRNTYGMAFTEACINGQLLIAQFLITLYAFNNWAKLFGDMIYFKSSNLATIQWVYMHSLSTSTPIDLAFRDFEYFYFAVHSNSVDVANWIYDTVAASGKLFNIHAFGNMYFKTAIEKNSHDMLKFLVSKTNGAHLLDFCTLLIDFIIVSRKYDMIYTVVDLSQLHKPTAMYDIACIAIKKNDYDLFLWSLTSKYHLDINVNDHILMKYCVNHNMGKFVEAVLYYYSVYYKAYITENGSIAIDSLNPFIECIKQKFYKRGIYIMQLIKSTDKKVIDCGICMKAAGDEDEDESAPFVVTTACQHSFCLSCFVNWQENPISQRRCALCRRYVKYDETTCYHNA